MAIYVYPPVSLSITSGPVSFVQDGTTVTVREDTSDPSQNRPLPTKLIDPTSGDYISPATELKQDTIITELTTIRNKDFATETTLATIPGKIDSANAKLDQVVADLDALNLKDFSTSAKQDTAQASLTALVAKDFSTSAKQDASNTKLDTLIAKDFSTSAKQDAAALLFGAVTETAPVSDTASSGLNGRLQRIAQRLTSLIALLPTALGQGTMAQSLKVVIASDQSTIVTSSTAGTNLDTNLGAKADTVATTDTGTFSLISLQKKVNQSLTALIALLPASLGSKLSSASLSVVPASDANFSVKPKALTNSFAEFLTLSTVQTFTAPANAVGGKIQALGDNLTNIRYQQGGTATTTSGIRLEPGRSEDFIGGSNISVISESGTNAVSVNWTIQA